jgi:predicted ArsR family transcriptional regulator
MEKIETGVDKLVALVAERKRVSVDDVAKELGVSTVVIQEWAQFLEEEGVLSMEYSLSKVFLTERKLSKNEVQKKEKEYSTKKDAFVRKAETTIQTLDQETQEFEVPHKDFEVLKQAVDRNVEDVKEKMKQLSHYEELKNKLDVVILQQKQRFEKLVAESHAQVKDEEEKYEQLIGKVQGEEVLAKEHLQKIQTIQRTEESVKERISALSTILQDLQEKAKGENEYAAKAAENTIRLQATAGRIEEALRVRREKVITPLIKLSQEHADKITGIQDEVIRKIRMKQDEINKQAGMDVAASEKFKKFFAKKQKLDELFKNIEDERAGLKKDLVDLMNKATAFRLAQQSANIKSYVGDLEKQYKDVEQKKEVLKDHIKQLHAYLQQ